MEKYPESLKLEVVKYYMENNKGYVKVGQHFGVSDSSVLQWVRRYKEKGRNGLKRKSAETYDGNFKQYVVEYMIKHHLSYLKTTIHFNLGNTNIVSEWAEKYKKEGPQSLYQRKPYQKSGKKKRMKKKAKKNINLEEEYKKLKEENLQLQMENEYLKKLDALVQERIKRENKKK